MQRADRVIEHCERTLIAYHIISDRQTLLARGLRIEDGIGEFGRDAITFKQACLLQIARCIDHQYAIHPVVVPPVFHQ